MNRRQVLLGAAALSGCSLMRPWPLPNSPLPLRSVSLGNALEAPNEGDWGYRIEQRHLQAIAAAGFDGVRLPVRWDAHADTAEPYAIDPAFLARVEEVVQQSNAAGLKAQLDLHHYAGLIMAPRDHRKRFLEIWRQIAARFANVSPDKLLFEPFNEPRGIAWNGRMLTTLQQDVIAIIREISPLRPIVLGPGDWQSIGALSHWSPPHAEGLAVSVHYYDPFPFTHQHAVWLGADAPVFPRQWGTPEDVAKVREDIASAVRWARIHGFPLQLGEFGVNSAVPLPQRALWTRTVREICERQSVAWCAWDFAAAFPIYDKQADAFIPEMRDALLGRAAPQ